MTPDSQTPQINITVHVTVERPKTEAELFWQSANAWSAALQKLWANRIAYELKNGNRLFENITTHEQYVAACEADNKRRRKELGFWKYYFA